VLLHGFPLSGAIWHEQQQRLRDRYRVITPDLRGHGQSPAPPGVYSMDALARDVLALLDSLEIAKAVIIGHSMGGYATLAAWKLAPQRFLALGLVSSHAGADTEDARQARLRTADQVAVEGNQVLAAAMLRKLFATGLPRGDPVIEPVRQMILGTTREGVIGALHGMAARPSSEAVLPDIDVPMLVLAGDQDQIIPLARAEGLAAAIPNATLSVIHNAGHMPMLERPEATTTALRNFLGTVR